MKKLTFLLLFIHSFLVKGQCDVAITDVNLNTYEVTVEVINSEGCLPAGIGGVPGAVTMLQIGYHLPEAINPDNQLVDLASLPNAPCSPQWVANGWGLGMVANTYYQPPASGWWYSPSVSNTFDEDLMGENGLTTGDVVVIPLNPPGDYVTYPYPLAECGDDLIDHWVSEGECIEFVVWQLNYGATWHVGNGGWALADFDGPGTYQDQNCNNSWYMCRDENPGAPVANPDFCEVVLDECNDPTACNYNNQWTEDGGFCIYCDTPDGEELCNEYQNSDGYWEFYFNAFDCSPGCTDILACNYDPDAEFDDGSCAYCDEELCDDVPPYCYGCTDPIALNYDEEAIINDSTCIYSTGPDLITIDFNILDQECLADGETHVVTYQITVVNIGTEDVGEFCMNTFLSPNQYNCPFVIDINPLDTATFQGSFQASWFSGQNNYVTLSSVEGLNGQPEIITGNNNFVFSMPEFEECDYTDIEASNLNIITECNDGISRFKLTFSGENLGNDTITNYCYTWGEVDGITQTACVSSDGTYPSNNDLWEIPPGQTQNITSGWIIPSTWCGEYFAEFTNVNGEPTSLTDNNFTSDFFPDDPCEPDTIFVELPPDTLVIVDTLLITTIDTLYVELPPDTIIEIETEFVYDTTYIELPPDTVLLTQIDTLIINTTDTLYVELPPDTITLVETEFVYDTTYIETVDTLYVELPPDTITVTETEFIFVTDTIFETEVIYITDSLYITLTDTVIEYQFIEIDCSTGLPCNDLGFEQCDPLVVYIPNTFTPNNDGFNDVWEVVLDPECWTDIEVKVFNRWGNLVWESYDPYYLQWNGSNMNSSYYVPDGVYYWMFTGRKVNTTVVEDLQGHVTIFR